MNDKNIQAGAESYPLSGETECDLYYASRVLEAIANRAQQVGDVIEPVSDIRHAQRLAKVAFRRISRAITSIDSTAALRARGAVPSGWVLVPVEPTITMLEAGAHNVNCNYHYGTPETIARHAYSTMLAASPQAPAYPTSVQAGMPRAKLSGPMFDALQRLASGGCLSGHAHATTIKNLKSKGLIEDVDTITDAGRAALAASGGEAPAEGMQHEL